MPISVTCPNGHKLTAKDKLAGKTVRCPKCEVEVTIPLADEPESDSELEMLDEWDPLASGGTEESEVGLPAADPLGDLGEFGEPHTLSELPSAPQASLPQPSTPQSRPADSASSARSAPIGLIWAAAGGGLFVGLLLVSLVGWMLLSGGETREIAVANRVSQETGLHPLRRPTSTTGSSTLNPTHLNPLLRQRRRWNRLLRKRRRPACSSFPYSRRRPRWTLSRSNPTSDLRCSSSAGKRGRLITIERAVGWP